MDHQAVTEARLDHGSPCFDPCPGVADQVPPQFYSRCHSGQVRPQAAFRRGTTNVPQSRSDYGVRPWRPLSVFATRFSGKETAMSLRSTYRRLGGGVCRETATLAPTTPGWH